MTQRQVASRRIARTVDSVPAQVPTSALDRLPEDHGLTISER